MTQPTRKRCIICVATKMEPRKLFANRSCLVFAAIILITIGTILILISPRILNNIVDEELILSPEKHLYTQWKKTPIPLTLQFFFFNWTNPEELRNPDVKPHLVQMGPYKFTETKEKVDIVFHDNGTVSFRQLRKWYFDAENSNGSLSDMVTTLNAVAVTAAAKSKGLSYMLQAGLSMSMRTLVKELHITQNVGDLLFNGYQDTLIDVARNMPSLPGIEVPPHDKFGWFYLRNGSTDFDGLFLMGTGRNGEPLGKIERWNHKTNTHFYEGHCGDLIGSAGEFWPPYITKEDLYLFSPDMCRSINFQYEKEVFVNGVKGYRFIGGEKTMDNGTLYPENSCFCGGECVPSGLLNVSACRYGTPGFISFPHFYLADPYYLDQFDGLQPNRDEHEFSITLEPRTGVPLAVSAKFQINMLMQPDKNVGLLSDVPKLFFPMIWFKQEVVIPEKVASDLKIVLSLPGIIHISSICLISVGGALLLYLILSLLWRKYQIHSATQQLNNNQDYIKESVPLNEKEAAIRITTIKQ